MRDREPFDMIRAGNVKKQQPITAHYINLSVSKYKISFGDLYKNTIIQSINFLFKALQLYIQGMLHTKCIVPDKYRATTSSTTRNCKSETPDRLRKTINSTTIMLLNRGLGCYRDR